jgi:hypothetical protein
VSVQFDEVWPNSGVDAVAEAMIVPFGGSNIVQILGSSGLRLFPDGPILGIKELDSRALAMDKVLVYSVPTLIMAAEDPGSVAALQLKIAGVIDQQLASRVFAMSGKAIGRTKVYVAKGPKAGPGDPSLQVAVLKRKTVKLSIRPVFVSRDKQGNPIFHCEKNFDTKVLLDRINAIWTPQTNIVFKLTSSDPAPMDDEVAIAKALKGPSARATLPKVVPFDDFKDMFKKLRDKETPKPNFTIFLVHQISDNFGNVFGASDVPGGFALVSDDGRDEDMKAMAHEIGHLFGKGDDNRDEDLLMCPGDGDGKKIPFKDTIEIFNKNDK